MNTTTKNKAPTSFKQIPKTWQELNVMRPLRPIHDDVDLDNATEIIDAMAGHDLAPDQDDYLDALSTLVAAYEDKYNPVEVRLSGLDALRSLVKDHEMNASDLGRLLDVHRSHASKILKGERRLTTEHLRLLSERFKVSTDLFIG